MKIISKGRRLLVSENRWVMATYSILFILILSGLPSCSQEAKKELHWKRGERYFSENKFKEAIIEYKNVVQIDSKDPKAHYKLGLAHLRAMQFREAFSEFSKSVELDNETITTLIFVHKIVQ